MTTTHSVPRSAGPRGRWLAVAAGVVILLISAAVAVLVGARYHSVTSSTFDGVREIVVEVDSGSIALARAPGATAEITVSREWHSAEPSTSAAVVDGVLRISAHCADDRIGCATTHDITVPAGAIVRLGLGAGSVQADGLDVRGFDAELGIGSVSATFATPPDRIALRVDTGSLLIAVPRADYDVDTRVTAGVTDIGVPDVSGAARTLSVDAGSGSVQVAIAG